MSLRPPSVLPSERDRAVLRGFASRVDAHDAGAHNNLGVLYYNKGMLDEAVAAFINALSIDPRMTTAERNLHIAWRETGLFDHFVTNVSAGLERDPADVDSRRWLADALLLVGDAARAIPHFEAITTQNPFDTHSLAQLARACQRLGNLEAAHRWATRALDLEPSDDAIKFLLAELAYHRGLSDDSLVILRDLATRRPDDADVQYLLGFVLGDLGHHEEGAQAARRALKLNPSLGRAEANLSLERRGEAVPAPLPEPVSVPGGALAHFNLGLAFRQKGYHAQALKEYTLALEHGEDRALVTQAMAEVHLLRQDGASATRLYEQLVKEQAGSPKLWNERGVALHQSGHAAEALESYERSVALDGNYALALNNLGIARFHAGRDDLAVDAFRRALNVDHGFVKARLNLALLLFKRREFPLCLEAYRQALTMEPEHPVAWNGVGLVLAEMKQFEDARNAFGRAIDKRPDYAEAHYNLSFTLSNLGDFNGALRETKRALELDPYYVAQKFELAIDLEYENPRVTVSPDLDSDRREAAVREFSLDVSQLESLFDQLAPVRPEPAASSGAGGYASANARLAAGELDLAVLEIQRAIEAGADRAEGLALSGEVFLRRGAYGEALDRFRQARLLDATSKAALAGELRAHVLLGRGAQAIELAEALALVAPQDVDALLLIARARSDAGSPARAFEALELARKLAPARADVLKHVGDVARAMGNTARAIEAYRQAVSLDSSLVAARLDLAELYAVHGAIEDAESQLLAALSATPESVDATLQLAALRRGQRRPAETIDLLVGVLQRDPWNLDALASLGESLFHTGRRDDARLAFARVLRFDPEHVAALYFDGVLLAEARQFDAAVDRWTSVIALEPAGEFARRARRDTRTAVDLQRIFIARGQVEPGARTHAYAQGAA